MHQTCALMDADVQADQFNVFLTDVFKKVSQCLNL